MIQTYFVFIFSGEFVRPGLMTLKSRGYNTIDINMWNTPRVMNNVRIHAEKYRERDMNMETHSRTWLWHTECMQYSPSIPWEKCRKQSIMRKRRRVEGASCPFLLYMLLLEGLVVKKNPNDDDENDNRRSTNAMYNCIFSLWSQMNCYVLVLCHSITSCSAHMDIYIYIYSRVLF